MGRSHKETNTYKFQNFSERIASMHIDVVHQIKKRTDEETEDDSTFFGMGLMNWVDLNCTQNFCDFREEISKFPCTTYIQLVHHSEDILATLKKHLLIPGTLALEPLLDLIVQLARDLGPDCYAHFREIFNILVQLLNLNSKDLDALEKIFITMAYLYKFLWRYLVQDVHEIYRYFSSLLTHNYKDYIQKFAAESFAFLMRKVKDHNALLDFLFKDLEDNPQKIEGVGQLLFEMMKGVKQHFHTVSDKVFSCILHKLGPRCDEGEVTQLHWTLVEQTVSYMMRLCADYTNCEQAHHMWAMLLEVLTSVYNSYKASKKMKDAKRQKELSDHFCRVLRMASIWLNHNNGSIVSDPTSVAKVLTIILKEESEPDACAPDLLTTTSLLLQHSGHQLSVEVTARLVSLVFNADILLPDVRQFCLSLESSSLFEKDVLPGLLSYFTKKFDESQPTERRDMLALLADIVSQKTSIPEDGSHLDDLHKYTLDFGRMQRSFRSSFLQYITSAIDGIKSENPPAALSIKTLSEIWSAVTCLPHISILDANTSAKLLTSLWKYLLNSLPVFQENEKDAVLFVMQQTIVALLILRSEISLLDLFSFEDMVSLLKAQPNNLSVLLSADLYFTFVSDEDREDLLSHNLLEELYQVLEANLVSWSHRIRLLTLHLLSLFPVTVPDNGEKFEVSSIFTVALSAERIPLSVHDYRERLMHLRKLDHGLVHTIMPVGPFAKMPVLYLTGSLLCPMSLLWEPVRELIATHARGMNREEFWDSFRCWLKFAAFNSEEQIKNPTGESVEENGTTPEQLFSKWMTLTLNSERPPDYTAFRNQLWKAMHLFPEKCEPKSRDIVPLFLSFLNHEYYKTDLTLAPTEDIQENTIATESHANGSLNAIVDDNDDDDNENFEGEEGNEITDEQKFQKTVGSSDPSKPDQQGDSGRLLVKTKPSMLGKTKSKAAIQSLLVHLELFAKFQSPRSLYREAEIRELFFQLFQERHGFTFLVHCSLLQFLEHKNSMVQKAAFDCVMTYKYKYLTPYRENFERLLDNKTFKSELVLFSVDQESSEIKAEHRPELLPVLMRILYGKMLGKTGTETMGKRKADTRRSIVFRFLAGCSPEEMQYFLDLVFGPFKQYVTGDPQSMVRQIMSSLDLKRVVPPKRMKGVLGAVVVVTEKLGHLLENNARWVLHVLLAVAATCVTCLRDKGAIKPAAVAQLKSVRQMAVTRLIQFFGDFDKYEFTEREVDAIMEAFVWPQLSRLNLESKCQPSPLLKLLQSWSLDPRHFFFLTKEHPQEGRTPLSALFSLLTSPGLGQPVGSVILKTIENLIEAEEEEELDTPVKKRKREPNVKELSTVTQGMLMIQPYIPALLTYIEYAVKKLGSQLIKQNKDSTGQNKDKKGRNKNDSSKDSLLELKLLARVSTFIADDSQAVRLCSLLMPFMTCSDSLPQNLEESTLESVLNLLKTVKDPYSFYRPMVPLFVSVERRQSRILLCQIFQVIGNKVSALSDISDIVDKLNAWNERQAEEPDYHLRLEMFRRVSGHLKDMTTVDVDYLLPLIYNCFFFIKNFEDLSLRDNATHCLVMIIQHFKTLTSDAALYREVMVTTILPLLKKGLRSKLEPVRHELLAVLQALVVAFPEKREFIGLSGLRDTDVDSDFFENIRHIQIHKQTRALRRLSRYLHTHKLRADQHMGYFVPLLYSYIVDPRYSKSGGLLDACVDLTCMICRQLPWENYYQILRLYLSQLPRRMETQRILIKVIVAILDGFHFDLSTSKLHVTSGPKTTLSEEKVEENVDETNALEGGDMPALVSEDIADKTSQKEDELLTGATADTLPQSKDKGEEEIEFSASRMDACPSGLATRIHRMVLHNLIPQLHKKLTEKVKNDDFHKLAQAKYAEDEEILRVPIAMAMIKLLQKLPKGALESKLPGILLRVCNFLKSRAQDIRMTARDTLVRAVQSLGARYLPFIIKEMRSVLTRGYQLHVLSFSLYHVLHNMLALLKPGDLDPCLSDLHAVYQEELFGQVSEEKDVEGITSKLFEAKTIKGYLAYEIVAQFVTPDSLGSLIKPLKNILEGTYSKRTANKVRLVFQRINSGLIKNPVVTMETMMVFVHTLTADNLPMLREEKIPVVAESDKEKINKAESCLLLPANIPRGGQKPKASKKTTLHVLVEFGLVLLHSCLKRSMLEPSNAAHLALLDPLVPSLVECLSCKFVRVNSATLRCLCWLLKFPLPSYKKKIKAIAREMFVLLKNYAVAGAAKGDNQELVLTCFRAVTVLVRDVKYYKLSSEHLQVLLSFCEHDLHDHSRQSTAFSVLKAILHRKLNVPELHELMSTIESMSITAEAQHLRLQCRQVILQYLLDYPLGKKIQPHLQFFVTQLAYEREEGRQSALEVLATMFSCFPQNILQTYSGLFFVPLGVTMINDESLKCRKLASLAIKSLLEKVDVPTRDMLFSITSKWMLDKKLKHRTLAAQLCGLFVEVEPTHFERVRITDIMPILLQHIDPLKFEKSQDASGEQEEDHWLFNLMTLVSKILRSTDVLGQSKWTEDINQILKHIQEHLLYPHSWVRLIACQIFGQVFAAAKQDCLEGPPFLKDNLRPKVKKLVLQMCSQLQSPILDEELANQIVKNMIFLVKTIYRHTTNGTSEENKEENTDKWWSVTWLVRKMIKEANFEVINNPKITIKRNHVFKFIAALSLELDADTLNQILPIMLPPLQREVGEHMHDESLKTLAQEVLDLLKKKIGIDDFSMVYTNIQQVRTHRKEQRKAKRAVMAVNKPEVSARKRMKRNQAQQNSKKRKIEQKKVRVKKTKLSIYQHNRE